MLPVLPSLHSLSLSSKNVEGKFEAPKWRDYNEAARSLTNTKESVAKLKRAAVKVKDENFTDRESFTITLKLNHFIQMWQFGIVVEGITNAKAFGQWLMKLMGVEIMKTKGEEGMAIASEFFFSNSGGEQPTFEFGFHPAIGPLTDKAPLVKIMKFFSNIFDEVINTMATNVQNEDLKNVDRGERYLEFSETGFKEFLSNWNRPTGDTGFLFDYTYLFTKEEKGIEVKERAPMPQRVSEKAGEMWGKMSDDEKSAYTRKVDEEAGEAGRREGEAYLQEFRAWLEGGQQGAMPVAPVAPVQNKKRNAFLAFRNENMARIKQELAEKDVVDDTSFERVYTFTKVENSMKIRTERMEVKPAEKRAAPAGPSKSKAAKVDGPDEESKRQKDPTRATLTELWKKMTTEEKAPYEQEAAEQKRIKEPAIEVWKKEGETGPKPKGAMTASFLFIYLHRNDVNNNTNWTYLSSKEQVHERFEKLQEEAAKLKEEGKPEGTQSVPPEGMELDEGAESDTSDEVQYID